MSSIFPQQRLLLELLIMSGDIAVADNIRGTILEKTLRECQNRGWVKTSSFGAGFNKTVITDVGRKAINPS